MQGPMLSSHPEVLLQSSNIDGHGFMYVCVGHGAHEGCRIGPHQHEGASQGVNVEVTITGDLCFAPVRTPYAGFYYMFYSEMRYRLSSDERNQTLVNFTSGCVAAVAASLLTQPADVLRTRMQLGLAAGDGSMAVLGSIVRKQGMSALLTGEKSEGHTHTHTHPHPHTYILGPILHRPCILSFAIVWGMSTQAGVDPKQGCLNP